MELSIISKCINSSGLALDIFGAWLVAWEVVSQFKGDKHKSLPTWEGALGPPQETDFYKKHEKNKYLKMKIGLACLTLGFILQILSNWPTLIKALIY